MHSTSAAALALQQQAATTTRHHHVLDPLLFPYREPSAADWYPTATTKEQHQQVLSASAQTRTQDSATTIYCPVTPCVPLPDCSPLPAATPVTCYPPTAPAPFPALVHLKTSLGKQVINLRRRASACLLVEHPRVWHPLPPSVSNVALYSSANQSWPNMGLFWVIC